MPLNLKQLNPRQREAVLYPSGPLLILAGAGSGKTSTMAYRIAHLIAERHLPATAVLGLSFTNKAAKELKERVNRLVWENVGRKATKGMTVTTFHSLCARLLRAHAEKLGFQNNFTIMDQNDQTDVLKQVLRNIKIDERRFDPAVILFEIGQAKNRFLGPKEAETFFLESGRLSEDYALAAASSFGRYQEQLRVLNSMDFDDLIFYTVQLLENHADVRDQYNYQFRHILVDEYQDTNPAQFKILKLLTEKQRNICVVGDDDQSIYGWRGADPTHILEFSHSFPAAHTIALEQNYRSTSRILEAANSVIEKNKNRYPKKLWSDRGEGEALIEVILEEDRGEAEFVAEEIKKKATETTRPWKDFAILYRSNSQSRVFEEALRRLGVPYKIVGGLSFLARKEVKDVLSYWRLVANHKDDASLRRILNWPARGIGKTSIDTLGTHAFENKISLFEGLTEGSKLAPKTALAVRGFRELIWNLTQQLDPVMVAPKVVEPAAFASFFDFDPLRATHPETQGSSVEDASLADSPNFQPATGEMMATWARNSLERIQAKRAVEEDCDDAVQAVKKWENVEELVHSIGQFKPEEPVTPIQFLREFLQRMSLDAQEAEKDEEKKDESEKNQVTLLTLHGAKGLEYPVVFLVGMEEGFLPHKRTIEEATDFAEERRLCYVGITRAKDFLFITRAKNRIRYGKPVPRLPSRFLAEIPSDLVVRTDQSGTPDYSSKESVEKHEGQVRNYLAEIRANLMKNAQK
jgi:DNA helicase-2/ATP-dependent DNA helicase PcrA